MIVKSYRLVIVASIIEYAFSLMLNTPASELTVGDIVY